MNTSFSGAGIQLPIICGQPHHISARVKICFERCNTGQHGYFHSSETSAIPKLMDFTMAGVSLDTADTVPSLRDQNPDQNEPVPEASSSERGQRKSWRSFGAKPSASVPESPQKKQRKRRRKQTQRTDPRLSEFCQKLFDSLLDGADVAAVLDSVQPQVREGDIWLILRWMADSKSCQWRVAVGILEWSCSRSNGRPLSGIADLALLIVSRHNLPMAHQLFDSLRAGGWRPTIDAYTALMNAYARIPDPTLVTQLFHQLGVEPHPLTPTCLTYNILLSSLSRSGPDAWPQMRDLVSQMDASKVRPDVYTYNHLLSAAARYGSLEDAFSILRDMGSNPDPRIVPDAVSLNILVASCGRHCQPDIIRWIVDLVDRRSPNAPAEFWNAVIRAFSASGSFQEALSTVRKIPGSPTAETYAALLSGAQMSGQWEALVDFVEAHGCEPRGDTLAGVGPQGLTPLEPALEVLLQVYAKTGRKQKFLDTVQLLDPLSPMSPTLVRILVIGFAQLGCIAEAEASLGDMQGLGVEPDLKVMHALMGMYGRVGMMADVAAAMETIDRRFGSSVSTFNVWMDALGECGMCREAEDTLEKMRGQGLVPDGISYNTLIKAFCKHGQLDDAYRILEEMKGIGLEATSHTYNAFAAALFAESKFVEAWRVVHDMERLQINVFASTCKALVKAYKDIGRVGSSIRLMEECLYRELSSTEMQKLVFRIMEENGR